MIVTSREVAERLGVQLATVYQWRQRGLFPTPDVKANPPLWNWKTVEQWAKATGRLKDSRRSGQG